MRTFFIDLASHEGAMACIDSDQARSVLAVDHRSADHELIDHFDRCLSQAHWQAEDIERIACVTGPGGFTSLRVAVTFANVLADQLHIPLAGVHLSDLWAARAVDYSQGMTQDVLWFHSTKSTHLFARGFGALADLWREPTLLALEECIAKCPHDAFWCGELLPAHRDALAAHNIREARPRLLSDVLPSFVNDLSYGSTVIEPWYGRGW